MSTEKLKKRKFKEKSEEMTLGIIKEPKTLETKEEEKKSGLDLKKRKKEKLPVKVADAVDTMTFEKTKTKTKKKSKLGLKNKDDGVMYLDGRIGHEGFDKKHQGVEKEKKRKSGLKKKHRRAKGNDVDGSYGEQIEADEHVDSEMVNADGIDKENLEQELKGIKMEKKIKLGLKMKRRREKAIEVDVSNACQIHVDDTEVHGIGHEEVDQKHQGVEKEKKHKSGLKKKRRREIGNDVDSNYGDHIHADEHVDSEVVRLEGIDNENLDRKLKGTKKEKKIKLGLKKKRRREKTNEIDVSNEGQIHADDIEGTHLLADDRPKSDPAKRSAHSQTSSKSRGSEKHKEAIKGTNIKSKKLKKEMNYTQKDLDIAKKSKSEEMFGGVEEKVEEIQSVDEDCSRGMKKWLIQYKESRPGLKILQERIDDYITAYEEQQEQERKEKEAQAAEGGWTVVVHHKGRKKTTDAETGVTVGSVAQAAVADKMGRKKSKEAPIDFYRFQKREAHRNEVMLLRSKFEQDKKRIQQLRAARKFRPY